MIVIKPQYQLSRQMQELIAFFNKLEKDLEYPNCSGETDKKHVLLFAEQELIKWGKI